MTYLYAALGIAMISGISIMFKINNTINNRVLLSQYIGENYNEKIAELDRKIIEKFYLPSVPDNKICSFIINSIDFATYTPGEKSISGNSRLATSCSIEHIVSKSVKHRVIIDTSNEKSKKYKLFSCILGAGLYCDFEI